MFIINNIYNINKLQILLLININIINLNKIFSLTLNFYSSEIIKLYNFFFNICVKRFR